MDIYQSEPKKIKKPKKKNYSFRSAEGKTMPQKQNFTLNSQNLTHYESHNDSTCSKNQNKNINQQIQPLEIHFLPKFNVRCGI